MSRPTKARDKELVEGADPLARWIFSPHLDAELAQRAIGEDIVSKPAPTLSVDGHGRLGFAIKIYDSRPKGRILRLACHFEVYNRRLIDKLNPRFRRI